MWNIVKTTSLRWKTWGRYTLFKVNKILSNKTTTLSTVSFYSILYDKTGKIV